MIYYFITYHRYRTVESRDWVVLQAVNKTVAVVDHLQPGERYVIQVRSVSHYVESFTAEEVEQTVRKYYKSKLIVVYRIYGCMYAFLLSSSRF